MGGRRSNPVELGNVSDVMGKGRDKRRRAKLVKAVREKIKAQAKA